MPTYAYVCTACGYTFDAERPINADSAVDSCVACGGMAKKKFTPPSIAFKGGGWGGQR